MSDDAVARAAATTARFREAVEAGDVDAFMETLAPDVVLHSPITSAFRFEGPGEVRELMGSVFAAIEDIRYSQDVGDDRVRALYYTAHIGRQPLYEATFLHLDDQARVREIHLFFRPLPGLATVMGALGPRLAARHGPWRAGLVRALVAPLVAMTRLGDRIAVRLVGPRRTG